MLLTKDPYAFADSPPAAAQSDKALMSGWLYKLTHGPHDPPHGSWQRRWVRMRRIVGRARPPAAR